MRTIIGWIRNLADGLGPPASSVNVHAKPTVDNVELDLTTHRLGALEQVHLSGGSGSVTKADDQGHFGWKAELSPGPINVDITPTDPQTEFRHRYPDESAQYGKAFLSDLERLGWAGGRDGIIWGAVYGGNNPTAAQWSTDPTASWSMGNGSIASFGSGGDAGRLTIRKFIAMLAGVPFTVEMGDLKIPVTGDSAMPSNPAGAERWDLICAKINWDPASSTYGKQSFEFTQGTPGAGVPAMIPNGTDQYRRLPLHAAKMAAGANVYSAGYDLRMWSSPPPGVLPQGIQRWYQEVSTTQVINGIGGFASILNTTMASGEIILPTGPAWDGMIQVTGLIRGSAPQSDVAHVRLVPRTDGRFLAGGSAIAGTNYLAPLVYPAIWRARFAQGEQNPFTVIFPLTRIPGFALDGGVTSLSRSWSRLRVSLSYEISVGSASYDINEQSVSVHLWPVT